ncbi:ATP-binding protein [Paenibacillus harenae]|uniref:ATP-binding protein n=1 Tax=Paenibacillus harenae TaxID=306543 RepID=UPI001FE17F21|nr:ATP-binding protein [Paenibacillus harenae]
MGIFCGTSMVLCIMSASNAFGYDLDFHAVPYMIGALYGGVPVLVVMSFVYFAIRIPMLDGMWETVSFILYMIVFIPLIGLSIRPFARASALNKERRGLQLMSFMVIFIFVMITGYIHSRNAEWTFYLVIGLVLAVSAILTATWLSIFMIESVKEKTQLHEKVLRISASYRDEVEKLQQFIDETTFAVIITDGEGKVTHMNDMVTKLLSIKPEYMSAVKAQGVPFRMLFQPGPSNLFVDTLNQALKGEKSSLVPFENGGRTLLLTTFSLRSLMKSQIAGAALIAHDVTEISQLRDELGRMERLSLVGQMAASITHEIRNPMAVIRGFVQLIQERSPKSQQQYFRIIIDELDRANMIISDFLSLAQNRALKMQLASLHDIINELIPLLNADANLRGQSIEVDFCHDLPLILLNDREIKQLVLNLARNGMEAMGDRGVTRISTRCRGGKIELRIADEGVGIPAEQMKQLFEPFFTTKARGTGLGLPLCLSIAERHNGRIEVESTEGEGTTFIVSFGLPQVETGKAV